MYLADTLSRAYLPEADVSPVSQELVDIDHSTALALTPERIQRVEHTSRDDPVLQELRKIIRQGWPDTKTGLSDSVLPYYDFRDELMVQHDLVFKGPVVVVPAALRKELMLACHDTHIGIEGCIRRARESMYWCSHAATRREEVDSGNLHWPSRPRSYGVKVGEAEFRRNRRQLLHTSEQPEIDIPAQESEQVPNHLPTDEDTQAHSEPDPQHGCSPQPLRRSERIRKPPDWITTYVPS